MFVLWNEDHIQMSVMLCICVALIVMLTWYIYVQDYRSACDRRIGDLLLSQLKIVNRSPLPPSFDMTSGFSNWFGGSKKQDDKKTEQTMLERHKKQLLNPEKGIMDKHSAGSSLYDKLKKLEDPLHRDDLLVVQDETKDEQLERSLLEGNVDGPLLEGMVSPYEDFERDSMIRQLHKQQEIYGEQLLNPSDVDIISESNM